MEARLDILFKKKEDYTILDTFLGEKLKGLKYKPIFSYFEQVSLTKYSFVRLLLLLLFINLMIL